MKGESSVLTVPALQQEAGSATQELAVGKVKPERKRAGRLSEDKRFKIFAGSANRKLAEGICAHVGVQLGESKLQRFADGEDLLFSCSRTSGVWMFLSCSRLVFRWISTWWSC